MELLIFAVDNWNSIFVAAMIIGTILWMSTGETNLAFLTPMLCGLLLLLSYCLLLQLNSIEKKKIYAQELEDRCTVIGRREARSFFESSQVGYLCPPAGSEPSKEIWINSAADFSG